MKPKIKIIAVVVAVLLTACTTTPPPPPENVEPSQVFRTENIALDGDVWLHYHVADRKADGTFILANVRAIVTVHFKDGREARIWTKFDENATVFIPKLPTECRGRKCRFSVEIDWTLPDNEEETEK